MFYILCSLSIGVILCEFNQGVLSTSSHFMDMFHFYHAPDTVVMLI